MPSPQRGFLTVGLTLDCRQCSQRCKIAANFIKLVSWTRMWVPGSWDCAERNEADQCGLQAAQQGHGVFRMGTVLTAACRAGSSGGFEGEPKAAQDQGNGTAREGADLLWSKGQKCWKLIQESGGYYWRVICVKNLLAA